MPFSAALENFEGPLELLLLLIKKDELDIKSLPLSQLIEQFSEYIQKELTLDQHAENLAHASTLLLWKSQKLLPNQEIETEEEEHKLEIFQKLIEYCRFREVARLLTHREEKQSLIFHRPNVERSPLPKGPGVEQVSLSELSALLRDVLKKVPTTSSFTPPIDPWEVSTYLERLIKRGENEQQIPFFELFEEASCKEEVIVMFLALLELMKQHLLTIQTDSNPPIIQWHLSTS